MLATLLSASGLCAQAAPDRDGVIAECRDLLAQKHAGEAVSKLRSYLAMYPDSAQASYLFAYALYAANQPQASLDAYTQAARLRRPSPTDLMAVSADYILLQDYNDAARWLTQVIATEANNVLAWYYLGRSRYLLQQYSEATTAYLHVLQLSPHHVRAQVGLGLVQEAQGKPEQAMQAYRTAQQWQEQEAVPDAQPLLAAGELAFHQGDLQTSLSSLQAAESLSHSNPRIEEDLGRLYQRLARYADAETAFRHAETFAPDAPSLHFLHGNALLRLGRRQEAQEEFRRAKDLFGTVSTSEVPNFDGGPSGP